MVRKATRAEAGDRDTPMPDKGGADRFHNQDHHSSEALALSVEGLEAAVRSLESRVANMSAELNYRIGGVELRGEEATRLLALDVLEMGEALSRRIRAQPAVSDAGRAPVVHATAGRRGRISPAIAGLSGALAISVVALSWLLFHHGVGGDAAKPAAPVVAALYEPATGAPIVPPETPPQPSHPAVRHHWRAKAGMHHLARTATAAPGPPPAPLPDTLPGSGGHSILGPSPG